MVRLADLLADTSLGLNQVYLADDTVSIRWVATSELTDPTPFLEGGELLLTTGLETKAWDGEWPGYVERLARTPVAGIGFGTGLTHAALPEGLVAACREHGVNLVEVPRATTFVSISHTVASMLERAAEAVARKQLDAQRQLTQAALRQDEPRALVSRLAELIHGAAALVGQDVVPPTGPRRQDMDLAAVAAEVERMRPQGLRAATRAQWGESTLIVQPIGLSGRPTTYLAVSVNGPVGELERTIIASAVALLGLTTETRRARQASTRRVRTRALEVLVWGDESSAAILLEASGGAPAYIPQTLIIARTRGPADALDDALATLERRRALAGRVAEELWLVAEPGDIDQLLPEMSDRGLQIGVGDPVPRHGARRSHSNAGHALAAASPAAPVLWWERIVSEGAMVALDRDRAEAFADSFLAEVRDDQELLETLRSFLRHNGSRLKVSDDLGIHRNTVRNRVEQLERRLGGSLDDPSLRASTWIALQVATEWSS